MRTEKVWSPTIRVLHWTVALCTTALFFTGEAEAKRVHALVGPALLVAVLARIWIGFTGRPHERFSSFFAGPSAMIAQLKGMAGGRTRRPAGHNPLAGPVMFLMLAVVFVNSLLGEFLRGADGNEGLLASSLAGLPAGVTDPAKIIHSVLGHLMLGLVLLHFAGLAAHSIRHKEPIVLAMVTGERRHDE